MKKQIILLIIISIQSLFSPNYAFAAEPVVDVYTCMGKPIADYMNAVIAAKNAGRIPSNIHLLSPAFNMTSYTFTGIVQGMKDAGADFDGVEGIAGNVYNVSGQTISHYMETVKAQFPGKRFYITETGTFDHSANGIASLKDEFSKIKSDGSYSAALLFNGTDTNGGWSQHAFPDDIIRELTNAGGEKIGINFATVYDRPDRVYEQASSLGAKWTLEIAGSADSTKKGIIKAHNNGLIPIVRIGIGSDSGGFDDVDTYINFLSNIASVGGEIYAIAGPNEPDLEPWLTPGCDLGALPGLRKACAGPYNGEQQPNLTEVIGHNGQKPWEISGYFRQLKPDVNDFANQLSTSLKISGQQFFHTNFSSVVNQLVGSVKTSSPDYIETRIKDYKPPATLVSQVPGFDYLGSFDVQSTQKSEDESYVDFSKRLMPVGPTGTAPDQLGTKSEIPVKFMACLQNPVCNAVKDSKEALQNCIKSTYSGLCIKNEDKSISGDCECKGVNPKTTCVEVGRKFEFDGSVNLIEPPELFAMERAYLDLKRKYVNTPVDSLNDRYLALTPEVIEKKQKLAEKQNTLATNPNVNNEKPPIETLINPNLASADTAPTTTTCDPATDPYQCAAGCTPTGCYGIPGQGPIWRPELTLDNNGVPTYAVCMIGEGQNCNLDHISIKVNGQGPDGGNGSLYTNNNGCYTAGNGGSSDPSKNLPGFSAAVAEGSCTTISFEIAGGRPAQCSDMGQSLSQACSVCKEVGGIITTTCKPGPKPPEKIVDCRDCGSWAPPYACEKIDKPILISKKECTEGNCTANVDLNAVNVDYSEQNPTPGGDWFSNLFESISNFWATLFGVGSGDTVEFGALKCKREASTSECDNGTNILDYACPAGCKKPNGDSCENRPGGAGRWICAYKVDKYLLYAYPETFNSDLNKHKSSDMQINNALFKVPNVTDKYFDPEYAMASVSFKLEIDTSGNKLKGSFGEESITNNQKPSDEGSFGDSNSYLFLDTPPNEATKTMNVGYYNFYQPQASGYCLSQSYLGLPGAERSPLCGPFDFAGTTGGLIPIGNSDPDAPISNSPDVQSAANAASTSNNIPVPVLMAIFETEYGREDPNNPFNQATYICKRNSDTATGPMQITDGTVMSYLRGNEATTWNIKTWNPGEDFSSDGRCQIGIAMEIAARILAGKANDAKTLGYLTTVDFNNMLTAIYASGGYYGTKNCAPDALTQKAWGKNISYCDYFIYRVSKYNGYPGQACTTLSPSCDGIGPFNEGTGAQSGPTQGTVNPDSNQNQTQVSVNNPKGDTKTQKDFLIDVQNLMNKYKDQIKTDNPTINDLPPAMIEEMKALGSKYKK